MRTLQIWHQFIMDSSFLPCLERHRAGGRRRGQGGGIVCPWGQHLPTQQPWNERRLVNRGPFTPHVARPLRLMTVTSNRKQKRRNLCLIIFCCLLESLIKSTDCYTRSWSTTTWRGTKCSEDELFQKEPVPPARLQRVLFAECSVSREKCNEGKWLSEFKWAHPGKFRRIISRSACCSLCSIKWGVSACLFEAWWPSINWPRLTTGAGSEAFSSGPWDL